MRAGVLDLRRAPAGPRQAIVVAGQSEPSFGARSVTRSNLPWFFMWAFRRSGLWPEIAGGPAAAVDFPQDRLGLRLVAVLALHHLDVLEHLVGEAELLRHAVEHPVVVGDSKIGSTTFSPHWTERFEAVREPAHSNCVQIGSRYVPFLRPPSEMKLSDAGLRPQAGPAPRGPCGTSGWRGNRVAAVNRRTMAALTTSGWVTSSFLYVAASTSGSTGCRASPSSASRRSATACSRTALPRRATSGATRPRRGRSRAAAS